MLIDWPQKLVRLARVGPCVLTTVLSVRGSAPRAPSSRMIVTSEGQLGSIGGGNLEFEATEQARRMLGEPAGPGQRHEFYGLGPALGQCCGGSVTVLFELVHDAEIPWLRELLACQHAGCQGLLVSAIDRPQVTRSVFRAGEAWPGEFPASLQHDAENLLGTREGQQLVLKNGDERFFIERIVPVALPLAVFGAGHVGKAVISALADLPFKVKWIDSRSGEFPESVPENTEVVISPDPRREVAKCPGGCLYLVMTHSHALDEDICFEALSRDSCRWVGLIGSNVKGKRFLKRLEQRGLDEDSLDRLVCPVGLPGISGKRPATIAVSIAAQLVTEQVPEDWR